MIPSSFNNTLFYNTTMLNPNLNFFNQPCDCVPYFQSSSTIAQPIFTMNPYIFPPLSINYGSNVANQPKEKPKIQNFVISKGEFLSIQDKPKINSTNSLLIVSNVAPNIVPIIHKVRNEPSTVKSAIMTLLKYKKESTQLKSTGIKHYSKAACQNLQLSKKTIDDYLMYIRKGIVLDLINEEVMNYSFGKFRKIVKGKLIQSKMKKWDKNFNRDVEDVYSHLLFN